MFYFARLIEQVKLFNMQPWKHSLGHALFGGNEFSSNEGEWLLAFGFRFHCVRRIKSMVINEVQVDHRRKRRQINITFFSTLIDHLN